MSSHEVKEHSEEAVQLDIRPSTQSPHQKRSCIYSAKLEERWKQFISSQIRKKKWPHAFPKPRVRPQYQNNILRRFLIHFLITNPSHQMPFATQESNLLHEKNFCNKNLLQQKALHETLCLWHSKAHNTSANYSKLLPLKTLHQKRVCTKSLY